MRTVLDTSVLIASDITTLDGDLAISAVSLAELSYGVLVTADPAERADRLRRLQEVERHFNALPVDSTVATAYGELAAAVVAGGRRPRTRAMDLLIAATARAHDARLLTRNGDDLRGIEHLVDVVPV
ncbi:type II toxin-antitoxin system VapC family toxin [Lapillicoccus jejuensis]|uniref:Ribonuclease VapC n=1 Tax=Lapillicoccus jejuensis TaxID=402171 RepID=A0A542DV62_9MICO|nr:type II toxin-antitoxin system VapC family toxin [Lapillicoccus jejuensis]TQJ06987.1 hypothetical protein FB458_0032 [Lapillicoccus jejuensis]